MTTRWWAFGVWAVVAASAVYWALKLVKPAPPTPPQAVVVAAASGLHGDLSRVLGADPVDLPDEIVESPESSRFTLLGVLASPRSAREGVALIAVDGQAPRAYRVGAVVDGETVVQSVRQREVLLGPRGGEPRVALDIPPPAPAATGTLPMPGAGPAPAPAPGLRQPGVPLGAAGRPLPLMPPGGVSREPRVPNDEPGDEAGGGELQTE